MLEAFKRHPYRSSGSSTCGIEKYVLLCTATMKMLDRFSWGICLDRREIIYFEGTYKLSVKLFKCFQVKIKVV